MMNSPGIPARSWPPHEIAVLRKTYPAGRQACIEALPSRTPAAIKSMAERLGIQRARPGRSWTTREISILKSTYEQGVRACVAVLPNRSATAITIMANRLGLSFSQFRDFPIGANSGVPLRDAIVDELAEIRNRERITSLAVDSLKHVIYYNRMPTLATVVETAELLGLDLNKREGWLEFANQVAERLPAQDTTL